jgi:hypothetical protein
MATIAFDFPRRLFYVFELAPDFRRVPCAYGGPGGFDRD